MTAEAPNSASAVLFLWGSRGASRPLRVRKNSGRAALRQIHDEPRPPHQKLVAVAELVLAADAHEDARARLQIREDDRASLLFDQTMLLADERVVREHEVTDRGADLQRVAARDDAAAGRAPLEQLDHAERRGPLRRRVEVRGVRIGTVVRHGIAFDREELV